ncbi:MAG TPA: N-formylglutamate amidohydrolase [Caulobacteraceae bacterium]
MSRRFSDSAAPSIRQRGSGEPAPYSVQNPGGQSPFLILGDHAGREIPDRLAGLGLTASSLDTHIAWDIGAGAVGTLLSDRLDATFIAQRYSRLVIDCNRDPGRPDSILAESDGVRIPGNQGLSADDMARRRAEIFDPYHASIAAHLKRRRDDARPTVVFALHSFAPSLGGFARPWRFGVLHLGQSPFSAAVLARLQTAMGSAEVGDNEPYRMDGTDYTIPHHALSNGWDYVELEVRQDLLAEPVGQAEVAALLVPVLSGALSEVN